MAVGFQEAVDTLHTMFSGFDKEMVADILQQERGHMERTVELLLAMSGEVVDSAVAPGAMITPPEEIRRRHSQESSLYPSDFLQADRYTDGQPEDAAGEEDGEMSQVDRDAAFAKMLQDEQFLEQLRDDSTYGRQFNSYLAADGAQDTREEHARGGIVPGTDHGAGGGEWLMSGSDIKQSLSNLGEATKKKMSLLAQKFWYSKDRQENPQQYRSLLGQDDDEEEETELAVLRGGSDNSNISRRSHAIDALSLDDDDEPLDSAVLEEKRKQRQERKPLARLSREEGKKDK